MPSEGNDHAGWEVTAQRLGRRVGSWRRAKRGAVIATVTKVFGFWIALGGTFLAGWLIPCLDAMGSRRKSLQSQTESLSLTEAVRHGLLSDPLIHAVNLNNRFPFVKWPRKS